MTFIVYADSTQRDTTLYPSGNTYTLHLTHPVKNVTRVDLVSAVVPNTMYNLTGTSNIMMIGTSNVWLNPGFYSTSTLVSEFNASSQITGTKLAYLCAEGRFIFYGALPSVTCLTPEIAKLLGLPIGTTDALAVDTNPAYANHTTYGAAANYVRSASIINMSVNEHIWLDIAEFRTPTTMDARRLVTASNVRTTLGTTAGTSFALVPMDVESGSFKSFKELTDYSMSIEFPSRLDSLERLTVRWLDLNGNPLVFNGLDTNSFTLRVHTVLIPNVPERLTSLPMPVSDDTEKSKYFVGAAIVLVVGLMLILMRQKRQ